MFGAFLRPAEVACSLYWPQNVPRNSQRAVPVFTKTTTEKLVLGKLASQDNHFETILFNAKFYKHGQAIEVFLTLYGLDPVLQSGEGALMESLRS